MENRLRFLKEIVEVVTGVVGKDKVGVRFAPLFETTDEDRVYLGILEDNPHDTYITAIKMLEDLGISYLSIAEADWEGAPDLPDSFYEAVRATFSGIVMYAGKYTAEKALRIYEAGYGDIFGFGRTYIANPDLPERIKNGWELNPVDPASLFGGTEVGYTDYPTYHG